MIRIWIPFLVSLFVAFGTMGVDAQSTTEQPSKLSSVQDQSQKTIVVPTQVAVLLRPVLDELERYRSQSGHDEHQLDEAFGALTKKQGRFADEALVVLMCFDMGESQEEADAVIARGRRMLPYIRKYQDRTPTIPGRAYTDSMLKTPYRKDPAFRGGVKAISHGWHSTADNPEG